ncbi:MAG TPA: YigZ family protein [Bacilli bacterium]|nr:YigZ family protein [Bacilli bacterium]
MLTIKNNCNNEIVIKKSKFITYLYKVNCIEEIKDILYETKKEFKDATHICYAYILDDIYKSNDDNEPSGTAGMPMLDTLLKNNLNKVLAITIRYFGGIKLGTGGLVRAYSKGAKECLKKTDIIEVIDNIKIIVTFDIDKLKLANLLLKDCKIISQVFGDKITFEVLLSKKEKDKVIETLIQNDFKIEM